LLINRVSARSIQIWKSILLALVKMNLFLGPAPPWSHSRLIAAEVHVFAVAGSTSLYPCKQRLKNCAEMMVSAEQTVVSGFLQKLAAFCSNSKNRNRK